MPGMHVLHQNAKLQVVLDTTDIGANSTTTKYVDMSEFGTVDFIAQQGDTLEGTPTNWNDALDTFKLVQATSAAGAGSKDISGATNTQSAAGSAGDIHAITINSEQLDVDNEFKFVAAVVNASGNTGVDSMTVIAAQYNPRYAHDDLTTSSHTIQGTSG